MLRRRTPPLHHPRPGIYNAVLRSDLWALPALGTGHRLGIQNAPAGGPLQITDHLRVLVGWYPPSTWTVIRPLCVPSLSGPGGPGGMDFFLISNCKNRNKNKNSSPSQSLHTPPQSSIGARTVL